VKKPMHADGLDVIGYDASWAMFNADRTRRYVLARTWDEDLLPMIFAMCNASTADHERDDATVRKCVGFAKRRGRGGIVAVNASPFIATDPRNLMLEPNPCDERNAEILRWIFQRPADRVAAWGAWPPALSRRLASGIVAIKQFGSPLMCYGLTKTGAPHHPSRIGYDTPLVWLSDGTPV
jgi:hypothetical protein